MKITLIDSMSRLRLNWDESPTKQIVKLVSSKRECENEFQVQRMMYEQLLCGEKANEIIADGIATIVLSPDKFKEFYHGKSLHASDGTTQIFEWVYKSATTNKLQIHIAFMDFLEGYVPFFNYINTSLTEAQKTLAHANAAFTLVVIVLMTDGIPWDFHRNNILVNSAVKKMKCVDFGRMHFLTAPSIESILLDYLSRFTGTATAIQICLRFFNVTSVVALESKLATQ
jgi:hypothetical protein